MGGGAEMFEASAFAYDRHVGRYTSQLAGALAEFAHIEAGLHALDVGCGPGALTATLASVLGPANVAAIDPSESFAAACRERLPGVDVAVAHAESLPFENATFDAALAQLVVNFMSDPHAGVREMARVTRPGGTVAACVWDYSGQMTLLRAFWDAALAVAPERAATVDEANMPWCHDGELAELWTAAGLTGIRSDSLIVRAAYDDFEDLWSPFPTGVAPSGAFCASLDERERALLRAAFQRELGVGDGPFELTARAWAVAGST
jgi:SAM-dependent methyltransferase